MGTKLEIKEYPAGHGPDDFACFGPAATKDGEFEGTMICDMGCFKQDGVDSNKYYHAAVVQSKKNQKWFTYFEYAANGATNPAFQMMECSSKEDAMREYAKQLHSKNDKRGEWVTHPTLGKRLQAKSGKDCYLVRAQATRSTGLPDAKCLVQNEGAKAAPAKADDKATKKVKVSGASTKKVEADPVTLDLMRALNVGTINFTRSSMSDSALPTQAAIDYARTILTEAEKQVVRVGDDVDAQVNDNDLKQYSYDLYSRIPQKKERGIAPKDWILSSNNIGKWRLNLDAFESALGASAVVSEPQADPFGGMPIRRMQHLDKRTNLGEFIHTWFPNATPPAHLNRNTNFDKLFIKNVWFVERQGDTERFVLAQKRIAAEKPRVTNPPLYQPPRRPDLDEQEQELATASNTFLGIHGTRSVNVRGLLNTSWRMPDTLVGVKITAWMFGPGVYWADNWKKSGNYTGCSKAIYSRNEGLIPGRGNFFFLADVALGTSHIPPEGEAFVKAPPGSHSVSGKGGHTRTRDQYGRLSNPLVNNEFIVYAADQCRMRYLIEFEV